MRRTSGVIAIALVGVLLFDSAASALASRTFTTFQMVDHVTHVTYKGKVTADPDRTACIRNRRVKVIHAGVVIAETTTDADGKWSVIGPRPPNGDDVTVFVQAKKRNGRTICRGRRLTKRF